MANLLEWLDERAVAVSNIGEPTKDNHYGRAATEIRQLRAIADAAATYDAWSTCANYEKLVEVLRPYVQRPNT